MRRTDFRSPAARLEDSLKQLELAWMDAKEDWSDSVSQKIEDDYLSEEEKDDGGGSALSPQILPLQ